MLYSRVQVFPPSVACQSGAFPLHQQPLKAVASIVLGLDGLTEMLGSVPPIPVFFKLGLVLETTTSWAEMPEAASCGLRADLPSGARSAATEGRIYRVVSGGELEANCPFPAAPVLWAFVTPGKATGASTRHGTATTTAMNLQRRIDFSFSGTYTWPLGCVVFWR